MRESLSIIQESLGINGYKFLRSWMDSDPEDATKPLIVKRLIAGGFAVSETHFTVTMRYLREARKFPDAGTQGGAALRDFSSFITSGAIFFQVGMNTGNWALATGSYLLAKFITNAVMHAEMNASYK
jgi:hypothetical protein